MALLSASCLAWNRGISLLLGNYMARLAERQVALRGSHYFEVVSCLLFLPFKTYLAGLILLQVNLAWRFQLQVNNAGRLLLPDHFSGGLKLCSSLGS